MSDFCNKAPPDVTTKAGSRPMEARLRHMPVDAGSLLASRSFTQVRHQRKDAMYVGHINLDKSMNGIGEHFVKLVESLDRQGIKQHVLVANASLARRVAMYENVMVGPLVRTPVMAYCLLPDVRVAHMHDAKSSQAGLVLRLTRSIPYIVTRRDNAPPPRNPLARSIIERASSVICPTEAAAKVFLDAGFTLPVDVIPDISFEASEDDVADNRIAAEHYRIYRRAVEARRIPALLL